VNSNCTVRFLGDVKKPRKDVVSGYGTVNKIEIVVSDACRGKPRRTVHLVVESDHVRHTVRQEVREVHLWRVTYVTYIHHSLTFHMYTASQKTVLNSFTDAKSDKFPTKSILVYPLHLNPLNPVGRKAAGLKSIYTHMASKLAASIHTDITRMAPKPGQAHLMLDGSLLLSSRQSVL